MNKGLIALAFGTFALGVAEYSMMSILPNVAASFGVSVPDAGHLISAYALGVCVGAPLMVLVARNWKLKTILLSLVSLIIIGNLMMSVSPSFGVALAARFISGLPHGAYFGTGVIVANRLAKEGKSASAVSTMVMGMSIANLIGVPVSSWICNNFSWRFVFVIATVLGLITVWSIRHWIQELPALPRTNLKGQFLFLKRPEPWFLIAATMLGNGGIFCWYSYINPLMTEVSGFDATNMPTIMLLAGAGMCVGNYLGGVLSDKYLPGKVAMFTQCLMFVSLISIFFFAGNSWISLFFMCVATTCLFGVSSPQQLLLMQYSPGGELMGGAMVQLAFNFGNALGAFFGGLPIEMGAGVQYSALIGAFVTIAGAAAFACFNYCHFKK